MDKNEVKRLLPTAVEVLKNTKEIDDKTRNKMSAFGATVIMSGLLPAVAEYSKAEKKIVTKILGSMCVADEQFKEYKNDDNEFFKNIQKYDSEETKERIINYVIAVKLALDATV